MTDAFPLRSLLPLRAIQVTLRFLDSAQPRFFHQPAVSAFVRHLVGNLDHYDTLLLTDAVESGRTSYEAGDEYRFAVYALAGAEELLALLLDRLMALPGSAPVTDPYLPLRNNLTFIEAADLLGGGHFRSVKTLAVFDMDSLDREAEWWTQQGPTLIWRWLTPAQLLRAPSDRKGKKGDSRFCRDATDLSGPLLLGRVRDALFRLAKNRGEPEPADAETPINPAAELIDPQMFWVDSSYRDASGHEQAMGGLTGTARLELPSALDPFWWRLLVLGQYLGIGQRRAFGWGRYRLEAATGRHTAPRPASAASLLQHAARPKNLAEAWSAIRANRGARREPYDDGDDWGSPDWDEPGEDDEDFRDPDFDQIGRRLASNGWQASTLRVCVVQKSDGDPRVLCVPPPMDRVVQRAVGQVLTRGLDQIMSARSHGYRRGRSRQTASYEIQALYRQGYRWVYESDVDDFFDSVDLVRLRNRLIALFGDDPVVGQVLAWVGAPMEYEGRVIERTRGLPQGSPLSPVLANLMLDDFDSDMEAAGFRLVRFADDFVVLCKDAAQAEAADREARRSLAELGLGVNPGKTRIVTFDQGFRYLGYLFVNELVLDVGGRKGERPDGGVKPPPAWLTHVAHRPARPLVEAPAAIATPAVGAGGPLMVGERGPGGMMLFVTGEPAYIATREGRVRVERDQQILSELPWSNLRAVVLFGRHHLTTPAVHAALTHQVPIHYASAGGQYRGVLWEGEPRAGGHDLWLRQQARCLDTAAALEAARGVVEARIRHLREVLRQRERAAELKTQRQTLDHALRHLPHAGDLKALNGAEGSATRAFFDAVRILLPEDWGFTGRNRRPPRDPFNAMLSLGYTVLYSHVESVVRADGLLPWCGFYHRGRGRHAALASDLMEPFRHFIEREALQALLRGRFKPVEFSVDVAGGCRFQPEARQRWLKLLTERFDEPLTALDGDEPLPLHDHLHRQNLVLIDWIDGRAPFLGWRMR